MNQEIDVKLSVENETENKEQKKEKKVVFSEKIDSAINGYAVGFTFLLISAFLLINNTYFKWALLTYSIGAVFGLIGLLGIGAELDKSKRFKGVANIVLGLIFIALWLFVYLGLKNNPIANSFAIVLLIVGGYAMIKGLIELFYSVFSDIQKANNSWKTIAKAIITLLTQICGLVLSILNILKIFSVV